jgi:hypothetical protein
MTTQRDLDLQQPYTGWVTNSVVQERCENEEDLERLRLRQLEEFDPASLPEDQQHIHRLLKLFWDLFYLEPPEDPLRLTPEGWRWHRVNNGGVAY